MFSFFHCLLRLSLHFLGWQDVFQTARFFKRMFFLPNWKLYFILLFLFSFLLIFFLLVLSFSHHFIFFFLMYISLHLRLFPVSVLDLVFFALYFCRTCITSRDLLLIFFLLPESTFCHFAFFRSCFHLPRTFNTPYVLYCISRS